MTRQGDQQYFRFRKDAGHFDHSPVWLAAENTDLTWEVGVSFRCRFAVVEYSGLTSPTLPQNIEPQLRYRKNGGAWADVNGSSSNVQSIGGQRTDGEDCSSHHFAIGTTHWGNAGYDDVDGQAGVGDLRYGTHYECEFVLILVAADLVGGDQLELRLEDGSLIDAWSAVPTITAKVVVELAGESGLIQSASRARPTGPLPSVGASLLRSRVIPRMTGAAPVSGEATLSSAHSGIPRGRAPISGVGRMHSSLRGRVTSPSNLRGVARMSARAVPTLTGRGALNGVISVLSFDDGRAFGEAPAGDGTAIEVTLAGPSKEVQLAGVSSDETLGTASKEVQLAGASAESILPGPSKDAAFSAPSNVMTLAASVGETVHLGGKSEDTSLAGKSEDAKLCGPSSEVTIGGLAATVEL